LAPIHLSSGCLLCSFNWYQSQFDHLLVLTGFVTRKRYEERCSKACDFHDEDFSYWKNQTRNYLLSQGRAICEIVQEVYMIPATLDNTIQGELQRYENNYNALNLITTSLGRNVYDKVAHLETAHDV
jgi:hypothetical protein